MPTMFDPVTLGDFKLPNRIVMAPLTRNRATLPGRVPNALMGEYYAQRASAGLIIAEAVSVEPRGVGYPSTPGIWSDEQTAGWKIVTDAGYHGFVGIEYEGDKLSEPEGIRATKRLLQRIQAGA